MSIEVAIPDAFFTNKNSSKVMVLSYPCIEMSQQQAFNLVVGSQCCYAVVNKIDSLRLHQELECKRK